MRHRANSGARTRAESPVLNVQVLAGFPEVLELQNQAFQQGGAGNASLLQVIGRLVFVLFVGLYPVADPDGVSAVGRCAVIGRDCFIEAGTFVLS